MTVSREQQEITPAEHAEIVRRHLRSMAQRISGSYISEGPALAHQSLDALLARVSELTAALDVAREAISTCDGTCGSAWPALLAGRADTEEGGR